MTKIVQLQHTSESAGGAAMRLNKAFLDHGIESSVLSLYPDLIKKRPIASVGFKERLYSKIDLKLQEYATRNFDKKMGLFTYPFIGSNVAKLQQLKDADVIYVHWVLHGFLSFNSIQQILELNKPVVFFLHDMWSITGGCHQAFTCEKYMSHCHNCPMFPGEKNHDLSWKGFEKKMKLYSAFQNIYFMSPSKWLLDCIKQSALTRNKPMYLVRNALDQTIFKPANKREAKAFLNIDPDETVISFGAVSVTDAYKGWAYLQKALEIIFADNSSRKITVVIFGSSHNEALSKAIPFKTKFMGYLRDEYTTSLVYNASDVFVAPSLADNLPYTIFEALSCSTPVVAFDVGGIPDLVLHKQNGYLAKYRDADDLVAGIKYCLDNQIKGFTTPEYGTQAVVEKHIEFWRGLNPANV
ncbi:glycosyltransferase [Mucilaginibacter conchicola]|uniref:Glycosyltransferase n=1 Tax=Mucilaginibacter conchicola TaxID=2303333 RepID=A0A372NXK3_9SPHI|nr:glycosyltransferase [Mucilaginibacter conchicola]RFZ94845.1 glycosyltransferase [Mucilaginibacter conchicola]